MANGNSTPLSAQTCTVPAAVLGAPGVYKLQLSGQVLVCRAATAPVLAKMDGGSYFPIEAGFVVPGQASGFTTVTLQNNNTTAVVITLYAGENGINVIPNAYQKVFPNYTNGTDLTGVNALGVGGSKSFAGTDPANGAAGARKQITVQNLDAGGQAIYITDAAGNTLAYLPALNPPWTLETGGTIIVKAPAGATRVLVGEVFYNA
jgi:hypothetical protein